MGYNGKALPQSGKQGGSKLPLNWPRTGPAMAPKRSRNAPETPPKWFDLAPNWSEMARIGPHWPEIPRQRLKLFAGRSFSMRWMAHDFAPGRDIVAAELTQMLDAGALVIVFAGTFFATVARCGWRDLNIAAKALCRLGRSGFDESTNRASLARSIRQIGKTGPLCADIPLPPDPSTARLVEAYLRTGSLEALHLIRRSERARREVARAQAVRTFEYAGELAPVFGLVGTLFAITQIAPLAGTNIATSTMGAISTAVLSSLYGVLTAHLLCIPVAHAIERRGEREEALREELARWLNAHLEVDQPSRVPLLKDVA
jgi:chemotaxis protein MotA